MFRALSMGALANLHGVSGTIQMFWVLFLVSRQNHGVLDTLHCAPGAIVLFWTFSVVFRGLPTGVFGIVFHKHPLLTMFQHYPQCLGYFQSVPGTTLFGTLPTLFWAFLGVPGTIHDIPFTIQGVPGYYPH